MQGSPRIDELRQKFHENPRRYFAPLANEYRKAGDPEQAIAICRAHLAQQPQHMSGHVVYGQALHDAKRTDEARTVFEKALALDPDNTIVLRQLGNIAREKGETAEARHWYSKALDLDPQDSEAAAYVAELEEPLVGVGELSEVGDAEERVADATPHEEQGDGAEAESTPESIFVMSQSPDDDQPQAQPVPETQESQASDDGMPEPEQPEQPEPEQPPEPVREPEPEVELHPLQAPEPEGKPEPVREPEPELEPEPLAGQPPEAEEAEAANAAEAGVSWRKTPHPVESPFVTRTMAELYVKQGFTAAALDVYRQLAIQHPDDSVIRKRIEELSPSAAEELEQAAEAAPATESVPADATPAGSIYMPDTDFSSSAGARTGAPVDEEGRHFSEIEIRDAEVEGDAEEEETPAFGDLDDTLSFDDTSDSEIRREDVWGDLSEAGAEEAFGERVAELDWTDPGFGFGASEPEAPETEPAADLEKREDETEEAEEGTGVANGARFVEMPVMLGEFQTSIDEAGMASTSPHELEIAPVVEQAPATPATTEDSLEADFRGDEAAAAMAAGEAPEADEEEEAGVVAYSPEPPRDEDLPHFTPKVPTVREFFATLGSRKPPAAGSSEAFTARAALPDVSVHQQPHPDDLPLATDAFSNLFPGDEIAEEDTRAAFALSGALSGTAHNPVPEKIQTPPRSQEPVATENQTQESEEDIRRFREWLDGLADS